MLDTFEINQSSARFIFSMVSFPFLSLFRLSVTPDVKPVSFVLFVPVPFFSEKFRARIALERRFPTRLTHSIPGFVLFGRISFHFSKVDRRRPGMGRHRSSTNLLDFVEQVGEVVQATDRRAVSVLVDGGVLEHSAQQH